MRSESIPKRTIGIPSAYLKKEPSAYLKKGPSAYLKKNHHHTLKEKY